MLSNRIAGNSDFFGESVLNSTSRLRVSDDLIDHVIRTTTKRDHLICELAHDHRVLTANQIADAFFDTGSRARLRLVNLYRKRLLDRFRPYEAKGSAPFHYLIGSVGALVVAARQGVDPSEIGYRADRALTWAASPRLDHLVGVNGFFMSLLGVARRSGGRAALEQWWSERRCAKSMAGIVLPDGYGVWNEAGHRMEFCLEYDMGTETLGRLVEKLVGYAELQKASGVRRWVLFCFPGRRREAEARKHLAGSTVPVATAHDVSNPAGQMWLPVNVEGPRRSLSGLPVWDLPNRD